MLAFSRRLIYALSNKIRQKDSGNFQPEKITVDFARSTSRMSMRQSPFDIKSESSYNAYLSRTKGSQTEGSKCSLVLGAKKINCIAWVEIPKWEYQDQVIEAKIRLDSMGGYASTGIIFRILNEDSYYLALVSSKGYFRLDVVKDGAPRTLIAWTDIFEMDGKNINIKIITYGTYIIFIVNDKWAGEINDDSINSGRLGFVLASYDNEKPEPEIKEKTKSANAVEYTAKAFLDYFDVDARVKNVEKEFKKWTDESNINAESRLRLAETFAVMDKPIKALDQINKAWVRRAAAIRTVSATEAEVRTKKELLLASKMAFRLGQFNEAEKFIDSILEQWPTSAEGKEACKEKIKILNELNKFAELKEFVTKNNRMIVKDTGYYTMLARCYRELKEYENSAKMWSKIFRITHSKNGVYAVNAANAFEFAGKTEEAISLYLEAGKLFLKQDNQAELSALMRKLPVIGSSNWEVHALAGKWAYSQEDYKSCEKEFAAAEKLRLEQKPRPKPDPALYYLWGMVFYLNGKNKEAVRRLEKAVALAPDYELFRTKLEEIKKACGIKEQG